MVRATLILLLASALISGCKESESPRQKLFKEVMAIHDHVMPKTADINKLSRQIKAIMPELEEPFVSRAQVQVQQLDAADEAMMSWMDEFNPPNTEEKAIDYLKQEKVVISEVRDIMLKSLEDGQAFIKSLSNEN